MTLSLGLCRLQIKDYCPFQAVVPSYLKHWEKMLKLGCGRLNLRVVMSSGDFLPENLAYSFASLLPKTCTLVNLYGQYVIG